ncbi:hypothetical protein A5M85_05925 [Cellulophaga lytica]|uniref:hypothetical protein n=1 Tax=Cellulophaga lytica TaxID=979 RepID=UPI0009507FE3|nr:hypothetical protein [Cellulophaga lytica]APU09833.1 hypothetical protein A5M85_05925 [Cellulophaga lytica]
MGFLESFKFIGILSNFRKALLSFSKEQRKRLEEKSVYDITPSQIKARLDTMSRFSEDKPFIGVKVKWNVTYLDTIDLNWFKTKCTIFTRYNASYPINVWVKVYISEYPEIKLAQKDDKLIVTGIITKAKGGDIYLRPLKIEKDLFCVI